MRVTTKMLTQSMLRNVNVNLQNMATYQQQLASSKRINRPSDDPTGTAQLLGTKSAIKAQEQYRKNMKDATSWLDTADGALGQANEVLQRARELAVAGSSGTLADGSMTALADEVDNLVGELVQVANTDYAGRYMFGGGKTATPPFTITGQDADGRITQVQFVDAAFDESLLDETYQHKIKIESGVTMDVSCGQLTFHTDTAGNDDLNAVFEKMIELRTAMDNNDQDSVSSLIGDFDNLIDNVLSERAVVGAKVNRLESSIARSQSYEEDLTALASKLEDADYAIATIGLSTQQTIYQASLAVGAQIIQPSLIDFLK
ncbi:MAG: flagellar hook-associated protein FlgL [Syntrophomonadaceae bacterium]|nr:flagellar hook-associated protein FlgL [Syntrophomonadaceae bacterium]